MPIPTPSSAPRKGGANRLEDEFQPILPRVDHIMCLIRKHQERLASENRTLASDVKDSGSRKDMNAVVDMEDKIIKEASATRLSLNAQKSAAHALPGGHLSLKQIDEGIKKMDKDIERNKAIISRFEERISLAEMINRT